MFHECLQSIPIDTQAALDLLRSLEPYIELQSTLAYLSDPPEDYPQPAVDIFASLQGLIRNVTTGVYAGEYDFQTDLYRLFLSARDGHFSFIPDLIGVGAFKIPDAALVSVSSNGIELPRVYMRSDILDTTSDGFIAQTDLRLDNSSLPSHVVRINGIPTLDHLTAQTEEFTFHDSDTAYNFLFSEIPRLVQFGAAGDGGFVNPVFYPGSETTIEFANGSRISISTVAEIYADFDRVTDGPSAYQQFCVRDQPKWAAPQAASSFNLSPEIPFYPAAVVKDPGNHVAGYFLTDRLNDTAVLAVLNFDAQTDPSSFQTAVAAFLEKCRTEKKRRLIIDVFANGGGIVELGLDLFVQLFPNLAPTSHANMRASPVLNSIGLGVSHLHDFSAGDISPFDVRSTLTTTGSPWTHWSDMYGPVLAQRYRHGDGHQHRNDSGTMFAFTNVFRPDPNLSAPPGFQITRTNTSVKPLFDPEDIVLLTDGYCASTCAIFAELLKTQTGGRVRLVAVGGRPSTHRDGDDGSVRHDRPNITADEDQDENSKTPPTQARLPPMQALGTTKGRAFWSFASILASAQTAVKAHTPRFTNDGTTGDGHHNQLTLARFSHLPLRRTLRPDAAGVNGMNHIRSNQHRAQEGEGEGEGEAVPLQFVREDADVRIFFTPELLSRQEKVWERVAGAVFVNNA